MRNAIFEARVCTNVAAYPQLLEKVTLLPIMYVSCMTMSVPAVYCVKK